MTNRNRWTSLLLSLALAAALLLTGCAQTSSVPAAKVADYEITVDNLNNMFLSNVDYATYYGYDISTPEGLSEFRELLLDSLISTEAGYYQAVQAGITLTDEEKAQAKEAAEQDYDDLFQSYMDAAEQNGATDVEATANSYLADTLAASGSSVKKLKEDFTRSQEQQLLIEKHRVALLEDVAPTAEELDEMYIEELTAQTMLFEEDPSSYFTYDTYYYYGYTCFPLYVPEGFFYVRHILVEDEALANELVQRIADGEDFAALMEEYNTDPGMDSYPEGYLVGEGASFVTEFLEAALALKEEGEVTGPVQTTYGYHIIQRMGNAASGPIDQSEIADQFTSYATSLYQDSYYSQLVEEWIHGDYVTRYPENYQSLGEEYLAAETETAEEAAPAEDAQ